MTVLVLCDHDGGTIADATLEGLTAGRALAERLAAPLHAVACGELSAESIATLGTYGVATVHKAEHEALSDYGPDAWADAVVDGASASGASVVMACGTDRGNEVLAHVAARTGSAFAANVIEVTDTPAEGAWGLTRSRWGGSLLEDATLAGTPKLLTQAHHSVAADPAPAPGAALVQPFSPELGARATVTRVVDRDVQAKGVTLATAPLVVGGGRGVGSADAFAPLEELAQLLEGAVGCSRAVTNNGWRPHTDQVGQTGTRIAPELYIAAGISGAIQHWVGAMGAKRVLAINTDAEANMVTKADYAVIADLHQVIPAVSTELRRRGLGSLTS